jgi:hypothetical protein
MKKPQNYLINWTHQAYNAANNGIKTDEDIRCVTIHAGYAGRWKYPIKLTPKKTEFMTAYLSQRLN